MKEGFGLHIEMGTVNVWRVCGRGLGNWEMSVQSMGKMGKIHVQNLSNPFLKMLTEGAVTTEAWSFFLPFFNPYRKGRSTTLAVARTL